jgi:transcriptional regulator with XRE-family HTH domain
MSTTTWIPSLPTGTFGERLRVMRLARDLSVEAAAERCDLPTATWRTWEKGAKPRDMAHVVEKIHGAMKVDRDWLMWGITPDGGGSVVGPSTPAEEAIRQTRCIERELSLEQAA